MEPALRRFMKANNRCRLCESSSIHFLGDYFPDEPGNHLYLLKCAGCRQRRYLFGADPITGRDVRWLEPLPNDLPKTPAEIWCVHYHQSGSTSISSEKPGVPWLSLDGPKPVGKRDADGDDPIQIQIRLSMCYQIADWLNGGPWPKWLDDMKLVTQYRLAGSDGSAISAMGPTKVDPEHPYGWSFRDDPEAMDMQRALICRLLSIDAI